MPSADRYFAEQDLHVGGRQGQEQFVRALLALLGPGRHRDRRDEEEEQVGEPLVEGVEIGQVAVEEGVARNAKPVHSPTKTAMKT
jgi:hypothetical protein